jgi:hypothetical protein
MLCFQNLQLFYYYLYLFIIINSLLSFTHLHESTKPFQFFEMFFQNLHLFYHYFNLVITYLMKSSLSFNEVLD